MAYVNTSTATYSVNGVSKTAQSNSVTAEQGAGSFELVKQQTETILYPTTIQSYSIMGSNTTGSDVTGFIFSDVIPTGLVYIPNSFMVDNVPKVPTVVGNTLTYNYGTWTSNTTHIFLFQCKRA